MKVNAAMKQTMNLTPELREEILSQPLYRQSDMKKFIPAADSTFEQGRLGIK